MTYPVRIAVFKAALEAVHASLDAHDHIVEPLDAWSFITNCWLESEREEHRLLPEMMPLEFVKDYRRLALECVKEIQFVREAV
jgi:hypothetical protein